jgi:TldD protein
MGRGAALNTGELDLEVAAILASGGGELADVFREETRQTTVVVEEGRIETAAAGSDGGVGLRIGRGDRLVIAHATRPDARSLLKMARELAGTAAAPSPQNPAPAAAAHGDTATIQAHAALCLEADRAARGVDKRVRQVRVLFSDYRRDISVATERGYIQDDQQRGYYFSVLVTATDGSVVQTGYESSARSGEALFTTEQATRAAVIAAKRAVAMVEAPRAPGGVMPVVLSSSAGGVMVHEAVGHGLEGDLVADGHSIFAGRIGEQIASPLITVIDDPTLAGRRGSYIIDDEGTPAAPTELVQGGVLKGWLHSRATAARMGQRPTGNGRRESYRHPPIPRMSNTFIAPGTLNPEEIVRDTHTGLFVTRMGGGEVDTVSGDFVFEVAEGFLIEGGTIGPAVRGATLAGNGPRVLMEIDRVGTDLGFAPGTCGKDGQGAPVTDAQPTLRAPRLTVGGATGE